MQPRSSMANSKPPIIQIPEDDEDVEFLCQIDAAEAQALSLSSSSKRRRIAVDTSVKSETQKPEFAEVIEEGAYTAVLKGSKSLTWQKQQQSSLTRTPTQSTVTTTTVGGGGVGGACFKCGKEGHWARDCPQTTSSGVNFGSPSMAVVGVEKACPCGLGICLLLTANTERNRGRKFFRCPNRQENGGCGFFEWCDESSEKITSPEVSADKAWRNGGLQQSYQRPTNQAASGPTRSWYEFDFDKGTTAPNASYGQKFEATENRSYGVRSGSSCFKCGQEGHWAKDCPTTTTSNIAAGAVGNQRFEATDNKSYGTKSGSSCFKCGQEGHWARDCPTAISNIAPAGAIGNQSSGACYKCGQAGHWARDCSSQSQGQSTKLRSW